MGNRSFHFLSKRTVVILAVVIFSVAAAYFYFNFTLSRNKDRIADSISRLLGCRVSLSGVSYRLPFSFRIDDIRVFYPQGNRQTLFFSAPLMKVNVSLKSLISGHRVCIRKVYLKSGRLNFFLYDDAFLPYMEKIIDALYSPGTPFTAYFEDAGITFLRKPDEKISFYTDVSLRFSASGKVKGAGALYFHEPVSEASRGADKNNILMYRVSLSLDKDRVVVDSINLRKESFYAQLWGAWEEKILHLKGVISASLFLRLPSSSVSVHKRGGFLHNIFSSGGEKKVPIVIGASSELNIFDLDCRLIMNTSEVKILSLDFSLNNIPLRARGGFSFSRPHHMDFSIVTYPDMFSSEKKKKRSYFALQGEGVFYGDRLDADVHARFMVGNRYEFVPVDAGIHLKGLAWNFFGIEKAQALCQSVRVDFNKGSIHSHCIFKKLSSLWDLKNPRYKFVRFSSDFCSGRIEGEGVADIFKFPPELYIKMHLREAEANCLRSLSENFAKIYGSLGADIFWRNRPSSSLWGGISIKDGHIDKLIFFHWLADFFKLPALDFIDLKKFSADFRVDSNGYSLDNINLISSLLNMQGYFRIDPRALVSSKVSMVFTHSLLESSPKFQMLLKYLGSDASSVNFNFQLSGPFKAMNFQWRESDFKHRLEELLPSGYERAIENKIEKVIKSISGGGAF